MNDTRAPQTGQTRAQAARVLQRVLDRGEALDRALLDADKTLRDPRDRALLRAIVLATVRGVYHLQTRLASLLEKPLSPRDRVIHALLLAALAQLEGEITPAYAVIDGSVEAARQLERPRLAGLVNAILRRAQREPARADDPSLGDEQRHDHPAWLIERLRADWPREWQQILAANNHRAPLTLRVHRGRTDVARYSERLSAAGIAHRRLEGLADAIALDDGIEVTTLPGFAEGEVSVQDGAAQLAADVLDARDGLRVLDACAAPGGKTAHVLEHAPQVDLLALDIHRDRCALIETTLRRLQLRATVRAADATKPKTWWDGRPFDRILIDAPCTGTGVIRRHPDIRLLRRAEDVRALMARQDALLDALWPLLAPGGRLVYSTCSVLADENERRVAAFLERTPAARALDAVPAWFGRGTGAGRQNLPGGHDLDGFYYAVLAPRA